MKIIKPDNLGIVFKGCVLNRQPCLSVSACACFSLDTTIPDRLIADNDMWPVIEQTMMPDEVFDLGFPKQHGEFLVYGSAFSPKPVRGLEVQVRVGDLTKVLTIFGNRAWKLHASGEPEPFTSMPIHYGNAFGGPDYAKNPLGKGAVPDKTGSRPLPNVQDPRHLVLSPDDTPAPAGFTAYPLTWPQRLRHLGKVGDQWLLEDWPHLPADTHGELFSAAPEDQRLQGFFKGMERIEIRNMHPEKPVISSTLPSLRARVFVNQQSGNKEIFREVPCHAETLWIFPDREVGILLYRGTVATADEEYEDILHLYAQWESVNDPPQPAETYEHRFREELSPPVQPEAAAPPEATPAPEPAAAPIPAPAAAPEMHPETAALLKEIQDFEAKTVDMLKKSGIDPETALKQYPPAKGGAAAGSPEDLGLAIAALEMQLADFMKRFNITEADVAKITAPKPPAPAQSADEMIAALRKAGVHKPELEAQFKESEKLMKEATAALDGLKKEPAAAPVPAEPPPETPPPPPADVAPTVEEVMAKYEKGEFLSGLDLTGLDFSGRQMPGADFSGTVLAGAGFRQAKLHNAIFREAVLKDADFSEADLTGGSLEKADASGGRYAKAKLEGANLAGADFTGADFTEAVLSGAAAAGATFENAVMEGILAHKMSAPGTLFAGANLADADFAFADLRDADFSGAVLSDCILGGAMAAGLRLSGATGERCRFGGCCLAGSRADETTVFNDSRFFGVDLRDACWEGARLPRAQMTEAKLDRADFSKCDLTSATLILATARETKFAQADLTYANLAGINLFKGSLRKANLTRTDLRMSNLYGVDFYKARLSKNALAGANIKRTLLHLRKMP